MCGSTEVEGSEHWLILSFSRIPGVCTTLTTKIPTNHTPGCSTPWRLGGRRLQERGREGGEWKARKEEKWERELLIDGLWIACIIHYWAGLQSSFVSGGEA
ncbi:unnamed protein product [Pleuronectes platessa]|uniref:Uncharacterized protein n=1 Tax=Pleuronectes platessa TaxID=8262 RepID=A0A9N7UVG1_PLEPL|nr:unnamed protein product [Pleuronectes platessa]